MEPEGQLTSDLDQLREQWLRRLGESLARGSFSSSELTDLARRYRTLAEAADSLGQRRAAFIVADRFERAARDRVVAAS